jgi:hypothetical protein
MDDGLMVYRLLLAVPLAVAGLKRGDQLLRGRRGDSWRKPVRGPDAGTGALALGELVAATGLLAGPTAWPAAVLALGCLAASAIPAAVVLVRPGGSTGLPVVLRAQLLAIPAVLVLWEGYAETGPGAVWWLAGLPTIRGLVVLVGVAALAAVSAGVRLRVPRRPQGSLAAPSGPVTEPAEASEPGREPAPALSAASLIRAAPELTIGMATYDDFDGVYFTLQALRLYHDLDNTELLVVDNYGCPHTRELVESWVGGTYLLADDVVGTAAPKDLVFRKASGAAVLCCDSHVLFPPGVLARLKRYYRDNPGCVDLLQGPLVYDDNELISTHFDPVWSQQMWGVWATDPRGRDGAGEPFEIPMQGLGAFSCRAEAWLGFHPGFRGFGGEEGYIHEKFRQAGRRCLCLPWLRWMHRFGRPRGIPYPLTVEDKLRNYVLGHTELGLDLAPVLEHFAQYLPAERVAEVARRAAAEG